MIMLTLLAMNCCTIATSVAGLLLPLRISRFHPYLAAAWR